MKKIVSTTLGALGLGKKDDGDPLFKTAPVDMAALKNGLVVGVAQRAKIETSEVDLGRAFPDFGFDSMMSVSFSAKLEDWLQIKLLPTVLWDYPTIDSLAEHLAGKLELQVEEQSV